MKQNTMLSRKKFDSKKRNSSIKMVFTIMAILLVVFSCTKNDDEAGFNPDFSFSYNDDNHVLFENESEGEYYSMIWDFGNGQPDTTTDRNKSYIIYYHQSGDYEVSLQLTNYTGDNKFVKKTINITNTDLFLSFTAEIEPADPNYVNLKNTTEGTYDSFKWLYRDIEVVDTMEHLAYFPLAGDYEIELLVTKNSIDYSLKKMVSILQDDPGNIPNLVWAEEFSYTGLPDPLKWNMETGGGGWGNNELQYYTDNESNAMVENGVLTITAKEESYGGRDYTSARITTQNKFDFKYGKIEARIKLPYGQGLWPAFWMLGANLGSVGWPACGEIDIMEMVGGTDNDNTTHATIHWDNDGEHAQYGQSYSLSSGILADDYHIYSLEWDDQELKAYIDDIHYFTADILPSELSEFHNKFFIILNVAVGGNWPGSPDASTTFPQIMEVDYVRVYQEDE